MEYRRRPKKSLTIHSWSLQIAHNECKKPHIYWKSVFYGLKKWNCRNSMQTNHSSPWEKRTIQSNNRGAFVTWLRRRSWGRYCNGVTYSNSLAESINSSRLKINIQYINRQVSWHKHHRLSVLFWVTQTWHPKRFPHNLDNLRAQQINDRGRLKGYLWISKH